MTVPAPESAPGREHRAGQLQASVKRGISDVPPETNMRLQVWPHWTTSVGQVFCWAITPLQFQSKLPQTSGISRN
jgi:hypothetical protein